MQFIESLQQFFARMDKRTFSIYVGVYISLVGICGVALIVSLYLKTGHLLYEINELNDLREETRSIKEKAQQVQMQRDAVNEILRKDMDFKIAGYFDDLLNSLQLISKKGKTETSQVDREDDYREVELNAQIVDVTMKQVTELLQAIEQTRRIYIKKLDILKSKKGPVVEMGIVIATLLPKTE